MKKRVFSLLLVLCMVMSLFVACGEEKDDDESAIKKALKNYIKGAAMYEFEDYWENSLYAKKAQKKLGVYDEDDYEDDYEYAKDYFEDAKQEREDEGIELKVSVDVRDIEEIKKDDKEFEWACALMEDRNSRYDVDLIQRFAIVEARVELEAYEDGEKEDSDAATTEYLLVKLGGDWYVTGFSNEDIGYYLENYYE